MSGLVHNGCTRRQVADIADISSLNGRNADDMMAAYTATKLMDETATRRRT
ncbi:hypothetical protein [Streptomyces sp. NPDC050355]|uniref:hypothetical protein n=1 Tax=Streptomyces sp. NPDC050355 TaxID=3365609 RepID=UPI0037B123E6